MDRSKHMGSGLREGFGFEFAASTNAVPINLVEITQLSHFYPLGFTMDEDPVPVAILGLREGENLFIDDHGEWLEGAYIPGYIRRYPFLFRSEPEIERYILLVDEESLEEGGAHRLFEDDSSPAPLARGAMEFCSSFENASKETMPFSHALLESDLLVERDVVIESGSDSLSFSGIRIIDEDKLAQVGDCELLEWREKGWLPALYAHLSSASQWKRLLKLLEMRL